MAKKEITEFHQQVLTVLCDKQHVKQEKCYIYTIYSVQKAVQSLD